MTVSKADRRDPITQGVYRLARALVGGSAALQADQGGYELQAVCSPVVGLTEQELLHVQRLQEGLNLHLSHRAAPSAGRTVVAQEPCQVCLTAPPRHAKAAS